MIRTCIASVLCFSSLASAASAQVFTGYDSTAYTSYYRAPAAYSNYGYTSYGTGYGYRNGWGPLGLMNWGWMAGRPAYGNSYTAAYAPASYAPATTSFYAPATTSYYAPATSYYAPVADTALAYYSAPVSVASNACCTPCCSSCSSGSCPGGNCSMNYAPADLSPRPDPASSGSRTIENESSGDRGTAPSGEERDNWRGRSQDGFGGTERGAGYPPQTKIEKKAPPTEVNDGSAADSAGEEEPEAEDTFEAPGNDPAASLLDLDTKVTSTSGIAPERLSLRARFQSPRLARSIVEPKTFPTADELRLVRK